MNTDDYKINNFKASDKIKNSIKYFERDYLDPEANASSGPYLNVTVDDAGHATIGWGHKLKGLEKGKVLKITKDEAQRLFDQDIIITENAINRLVKFPLNQNKFDALMSLVFNVGEGDFANSNLLQNINSNLKKEYIAKEFLNWDHITVGSKLERAKGLTDRRKMEVNLFFTPDPNEPKIYRDPDPTAKPIKKSVTKTNKNVVGPTAKSNKKTMKRSNNNLDKVIKLSEKYYLLSKL